MTQLLFSANVMAAAMIVAGCSGERTRVKTVTALDHEKVASDFAQSLAVREYARAYEMTAAEYRRRTTSADLEIAFERMIPLDWGPIGPIEVGQTLTSWPGKQSADVAWVNVSIGGEGYSEAVSVAVTVERGEARIRDVEFGRP